MPQFSSLPHEPEPFFNRPTLSPTFSPSLSSNSTSSDNLSCNTIYNEIILQSYLLVILNVVLFTILKFLAEEIIFPWIFQLCGCNKKGTTDFTEQQSTTTINPVAAVQNLELESGLSDKSTSLTQKSSISDSKIAFLYFQFCTAVLSIAVACKNVDHSKSTWQQYNDFYGLLLNSSALTYIISLIPVLATAHSEERMFSFLGGTGSLMCLLCLYPPLITHILPGMFAYIWVEAGFIFSLFGVFFVLDMLLQYFSNDTIQILAAVDENENASEFSMKLSKLLLEMGYRLVAIMICQTFYNYMYLLYNATNGSTSGVISGHDYIQVIIEEYNLRSQTKCLFYNMLDTTENAIVFFNWL